MFQFLFLITCPKKVTWRFYFASATQICFPFLGITLRCQTTCYFLLTSRSVYHNCKIEAVDCNVWKIWKDGKLSNWRASDWFCFWKICSTWATLTKFFCCLLSSSHWLRPNTRNNNLFQFLWLSSSLVCNLWLSDITTTFIFFLFRIQFKFSTFFFYETQWKLWFFIIRCITNGFICIYIAVATNAIIFNQSLILKPLVMISE